MCSADLAWLYCGPNAGRATPHAVGRDSITPTLRQIGGTRCESSFQRVQFPWRAPPALVVPRSNDQPPTQHARHAARTWRCCVVGQRNARSPQRHRPGLNRTNTATGRRHEVRKCVLVASESSGARSSGARPAGFSPRGVIPDRPWSTGRAVRTWRGCVVGQRRARSSPRRRPGLDRTSTATGRRHSLQQNVVIVTKHSGARSAPVSPRKLSADRRRSTHAAQYGLGVVVSWGSLLPMPSAEVRPHQLRKRSTARALRGADCRNHTPVARGPRTFRPVKHRPSTHGARALRSVDVAWLCCRGALLPTPSAGA